MKKILIILGSIFVSVVAVAQSSWIKRDLYGLESQKYYRDENPSHSILLNDCPQLKWDSLKYFLGENLLQKKMFYDHLLIAKKGDYSVSLDPAFNFQFMKSPEKSGYINTRGFSLNGNFSNRIIFSSTFFENQGRFPDYMNDFAEKYAVLPGFSRMKPYNENDWDYASATGVISFIANKNLTFRLGHDKLFIGSGHRSLLLSDVAFQQLFFQTSYSYKKIRFTNLSMQWINPNFNNIMNSDVETSVEGNYPRKFVSINMLEFAPSEKWNITLFEALVFYTENGYSPFDIQMINPFIITRSLMTGFNNKNNLLVGLDLRYRFKNVDIYSQLLIDQWQNSNLRIDNPANQFAYQIGAIAYDLFGVSGLHLLVEHNYVKAQCYANENPEISYTHYNQNIAHPGGSNFAEVLAKVQYRYKRFPMQFQINYMLKGTDTVLSESLMPISYYAEPNYISGETESILFFDAELGYMINPSLNWMAFLGLTYRKSETDELWFRFGMRTNIERMIRDF